MKKLFTSESVGRGHPDKICDQISDRILDAFLKKDPDSRVACEVMASNRLIIIAGEIKTKAYVDVVKEAWKVVKKIGYNENDFTIISNINTQSIEINQSVDKRNKIIGAGDQGIIFGFATNETENYMPLAYAITTDLVKKADELIQNKKFKWAKYDMKSQVTIDYTEQPKIDTILMSIQHTEKYNKELFEKFIKEEIITKVVEKYNLNQDFKILINPSGKFTIGGPIGDTGLTGRKIIVDSYGGYAKHGGGAYSGKDYTKVDRSAAYAARWVAKNLVAANIADKIEVQLSYGIGIAEPISLSVNTFNSSKFSEQAILKTISEIFDLSPLGIINALNLKEPVYRKTSIFGHFGTNDYEFSWEKLDKVEQIKQTINKYKNS
ncbi:methionine adenosyltransferase [[Mycoplasma] collis]|uniref:methionine adenosyltransferase n=1 Tax=[Mycoplasma] collis TaxID=2127 RepID=UPI00051C82D5|nr:methionine adenosyltransferase [[Mycoplasma] collis]